LIGTDHSDSHGWVSQAVIPLIEAVRDVSPEVRLQAIHALAAFGERAAPAVSALTEALDNEFLRTAAADALGGIGPPARPAWPKLVDLATESAGRKEGRDVWGERALIAALGHIGGPAEQVVPFLKLALVREELRAAAVTALGNLGPDSVKAVPELSNC
jgi:HEAT repeat protein